MGSCVQFSSQHRNSHMAQIHAGSMYEFIQIHYSLWVCMSVLLCLKSLVFLDSSISSGFWNLPLSYSSEFLNSEERFGRNILLRTECSKGSHASNIIQVWAPCLSKRKPLCWWLNEILMYESKRRSLGSILLVHYQNSNMWLFLRYLAYSSPFCGCHLNSVQDVFHLMEWALNIIRYWMVTLTSFVPLFYHHILQVGHHCRSKCL